MQKTQGHQYFRMYNIGMRVMMKTKLLLIAISCLTLIACGSGGDEVPDSVSSRIVAEATYNGKANENLSFTVALVDDQNNPVNGAELNLSILSGDAVIIQNKVNTDANGQALIEVNQKDAFSNTLRVFFTGNDQFKGTGKDINLIANYNYSIPVTSNGIVPVDMETTGVDSDLIGQMIDKIRENTTPYQYLNGVLIQQKGKLLLEEYFPYEELIASGLQREVGKHLVASVSKSVTSASIGIAIEKGFINSLDDKMLDYFPDRAIQNVDATKQSITIRDLLHMQSGLNCNDGAAWPGPTGDYIQNQLDLPMANQPGSSFMYCTGITMILGALIENATGLNAQDFANQYLFGPLGMGVNDTEWTRDPSGNVMCGYGLWMTGRDMVKFGQLYLNEGAWDGQQVVPQQWIADSRNVGSTITFANRVTYGYQWWIGRHTIDGKNYEAYYAIGNGGNYVINIPELEAVVVFHGAEWNSNAVHTVVEVEFMDNYIMPALIAGME